MTDKVIIYTDGSCLGNPGPGGYAAVLNYKAARRELWGGEEDATNNRMELLGAIKALEQLTRPCAVDMYMDSQYVLNGFLKGWLAAWKNKGWMTAAGRPVKNRELWEKLADLAAKHTVTWHHVYGHKGQPENERCDELAQAAARQAGQTGDFFHSGS
jgi:ribonuclease HI